VADSAVEWGGFDLPGALEAGYVDLGGKEVSEAGPDLVDGDSTAVSVDVKVRGKCLTCPFGF
jgi:hypothetical protein